jgi:hypothetical protein
MKFCKLAKLFGLFTVSAAAQENFDGWDWVWTDSAGTHDWSGANWTQDAYFGGATGAVWWNIAPTANFSGDTQVSNSPNNKDGTLTVDPSVQLQIGQLIGKQELHYDRAYILDAAAAASGIYGINRINNPVNGGNFAAFTAINARFSTASGTVTVSGTQYVNRLVVDGNSDVTFAAGADGALRFNPMTNGQGGFYLSSGNAVINMDLTNVAPENNITYRFYLWNQTNGSGTLTLTNMTLNAGGEGARIQQNDNSNTVINNVTFSTGGKSVEFAGGNFLFTGSSAMLSGDTNFGYENTVHATIAAGAVFSARGAVDSQFYIGKNDNDTTLEVLGRLEVVDRIHVGDGGKLGRLIISGTGEVHTWADQVVGECSGTGQVIITGSGLWIDRVNDKSLSVGNWNPAGHGFMTLEDHGLLQFKNLNVGNGSTGDMVVRDDAVLIISDNLNVGNNVANDNDPLNRFRGVGTMVIEGNATGTIHNLSIGASGGDGSMIIRGNAQVTVTDNLRPGQGYNANSGLTSTGTLEITGNANVVAKHLKVGDNAANPDSKILVSGGTLTVQDDLSLRGRMEVTGSGLVNDINTTSELKVGDYAQAGAILVAGGTLVSARTLRIGNNGGGVVDVTGGLVRTAHSTDVGWNYNGALNVSGGLLDTDFLYINHSQTDTAAGIATISGGTVTTRGVAFGKWNNDAPIGGSGTAHLNLTGGVLHLTTGNGIHTGNEGDAGEWKPAHTAADTQLNLGGGTIKADASWTLNMPATLTGSNGRVKFDTNGTLTVGGTLTGGGGVEVAGGTLLITGVNDYSGGTVVSGAGAILQTDANGTLGSGDVSVGAYGMMVFGNENVMDAGARRSLYFDDYALAGKSYIALMYTGTLTVDTLLNNFTGEYLTSGLYTTSELNDLFGGEDVFFGAGFLNIANIPEPSTWALLAAGAALLVMLRKRR